MNPELNGYRPEVPIRRQHNARFEFGEVQKNGILPSAAIGLSPKLSVAAG
jgi:hypothetical protein